MANPRRTRITLGVSAAVLIGVPVTALVVLLNYDWNKAKPWLNGKVSEAIGRPFNIQGDLSLTWEKPATTIAERDRTWRDLVPWPHLLAQDVHIAHPPGMDAPGDMASVGRFSFSLNPLALLDKRIAIPVLRFDTPVVLLQRTGDGKNNWTFRQAEHPSRWKLELERVVLAKGTVRLIDAIKKADVSAEIDTIDADPTYGIGWQLSGKYNGEAVKGSGKAGAVLSLQNQTTPYPIAADLRIGSTRINAVGSLTKPTELAALDMRLKVSGISMARLYALSGLVLPETPPFATEGHLTGTLGATGGHWIYDKFSGKVGASDIGGRLEYQTKQPRSLLSGVVLSRLLRFSDLAPVIGADSNTSKRARGASTLQPAGKVLPVEEFKTERWTSIDADIRYSAEKITRDKELPINKLSTHLHLDNGVLSLAPLNFGMAGGTLNSNIKLDGSRKVGKDAIKAEMKVSARHLKIKELFPALKPLQATVGEINGEANLSATGNSIATLLGGANGEIKTLINEGTVSKLLLEQMGLNIGNVILTKLVGDKQVKLNCMAADFGVTNGLMQTRSFIVDTDEALIDVTGNISLINEQLDLKIKPSTKGLRVFSLRAPLYVRGTFKDPNVSVDKGVLALRAGGALALAALAPVAALLPLVNAGPGENSECAKLLAQARVTPVAPAPGNTYRARPRVKKSPRPAAR